MFRQGQLAVHGLAILLGRNEAGISNRGKIFLHHAVRPKGNLAALESGVLQQKWWSWSVAAVNGDMKNDFMQMSLPLASLLLFPLLCPFRSNFPVASLLSAALPS